MRHSIKFQKTYKTANSHFKIDVDFSIPDGQITGIFGPSGAGKTSILRLLAGLDTPSKGYININNKIWVDSTKNISLKTQDRGLGFVFQKENLFPNMSVLENLKFALKAGQNETKLHILISDLGIEHLLQHKPSALSGGQRQIIALARSLVQDPSILLLDEPFSSLDDRNTNYLVQHIQKIQRIYKTTIIIVSHDKEVISRLCTEVLIIKKGQLIQQGAISEIWPMSPQNEAEIIGINVKEDHIEYSLSYNSKEFVVRRPKMLHNSLKIGDKIHLTFE